MILIGCRSILELYLVKFQSDFGLGLFFEEFLYKGNDEVSKELLTKKI